MITSRTLGRRAVLAAGVASFTLFGCAGSDADDVTVGAAEEGCTQSAVNDYFDPSTPGMTWTDHFPDERGAIEFLMETTAELPENIYGPVERTAREQLIMESQLAAYAALERDEGRSTDERAVWVGPHAEVVLVRTEHGWRVESEASELPAEVCAQLREDRALRHPGSDADADAENP